MTENILGIARRVRGRLATRLHNHTTVECGTCEKAQLAEAVERMAALLRLTATVKDDAGIESRRLLSELGIPLEEPGIPLEEPWR